ncbi:MAG: serine hydrolase [Gemmatimonadales bacterium]
MPIRPSNALILAAALAVPYSAGAQPATDFERYVRAGMEAWEVPGLAVAVVRGDEITFMGGFGLRELGKPDRVDVHTRFAIGSITKTFTATLVGMLADDGLLDIDRSVSEALPGFVLRDPYVTREVTLRDLLSHRTGVAGGDLLWASGDLTRDEIVHRLRFLPQTWSLRSRFDYSNVMVIAAGQAVAAVSGRSWDEVVRQRLLGPLGMTESVTSVRDLPAIRNVATPHDPASTGPIPVPWRNMDNTAASGGINSSIHDMARWVRFQLTNGVWDGRPLVSRGYVDEMRRPQTLIRREGAWARMSPDAHFMAYGLGWIMSDHAGRLLLQHGGGIDGMSAMMGLMPEEGIGVVVLSNLNGNQLPAALMLRAIDQALGLPDTDWSARFLEETRQAIAAAEQAERSSLPPTSGATTPSLPIEGYAGTYRDETLGSAVVSVEGGKLMFRYGTQFRGELEHVSHDVFRAHWENPARGTNYVSFTLDALRNAASVDLHLWVTAHFERDR